MPQLALRIPLSVHSNRQNWYFCREIYVAIYLLIISIDWHYWCKLDKKAQTGPSFYTLSHWYDTSPSQNTRETCPYSKRLPERDYSCNVTSHIYYAKSAHLCHKRMRVGIRLTIRKWFFTFRCSERFLDGVCSGMTIEDVLMHAIKVSARLTSGSGITKSTLANWGCTLPMCISPYRQNAKVISMDMTSSCP